MPYVTATATPSTEIYYEDIGSGAPVVLIHGWPLSQAMWEGQINALVAAGYRCVSYDRRGFGRSGRPTGGYDYDTFASDLNDVLTAIDLREVTLAGFSMGGGEVARYIGRYGTDRVRKAMLIAAVPPFLLQTPDNPAGVPGTVFEEMLAGVTQDRVAFLESFMKNFFNWTPGSGTPSDDVVAFAKSIAWSASPLGTQQCIVAFGKTDFRADLKKFDVPTLVVHGDRDQIVPVEVSGKLSAQLIAGARLEVVKGAPHGLNATHGGELNRLMLDFIAG
jgi:pimeloyl-ACP methyl ester carboxylesterase